MQHVRQINANDCGIAVAAMLTGRAYRTTMRAAGFTPHREEGLYVSEMIALLSGLTGREWKEWKTVAAGRLTLRETAFPDGVAVVIGRRTGVPFGHWIAIRKGMAYDPELRAPLPMDDYPRGHWRVLRVVICGGP
ncbi:hypothetical protein FVF58_01010 [Paraburkholderia panacisoli]|uniref:Peptidase C39 domain-containing protein n=1 Tax=Paraburkholderia panacisoli TaxID=2603818 RepID=A0A5B0HME8_9BURK|nr:hypothetical protein [Paraburkholderia panacisoli]KAA1015963.1 hypothetical protein FVF58_01010 [Paraburkholderia panacisoli]